MLSFSRTVRRRPGRRSKISRAVARPRIPAPTIATSVIRLSGKSSYHQQASMLRIMLHRVKRDQLEPTPGKHVGNLLAGVAADVGDAIPLKKPGLSFQEIEEKTRVGPGKPYKVVQSGFEGRVEVLERQRRHHGIKSCRQRRRLRIALDEHPIGSPEFFPEANRHWPLRCRARNSP